MNPSFLTLRNALLDPILKKPTPTPAACLSTGSILLDKMLSVGRTCALRRGDIIWFHGSSGTCRTFLAHQILAEAASNSLFGSYRLFYDNPMSARPISFFGENHRSRVEYAASVTIDDWLTRLRESTRSGQFIYVLDSINALQGDSQKNHQLLNAYIRDIAKQIKETQSILLFISDDTHSFSLDTTRTLRDVPDIILHFGHPAATDAPRYSVLTDVHLTVQKRPVISNFQRENLFSFIPDYGIDDAKACFQYLFRQNKITRCDPIRYSLASLNMPPFTFEEFTDEFDDIKSLISTLI